MKTDKMFRVRKSPVGSSFGRSPSPLPVRPAAPLYFRRLGGKLLFTNDWGGHVVLGEEESAALLGGCLKQGGPLWNELLTSGFIRERMDFSALADRFQNLRFSDSAGPELHTIEVTRRCNLSCTYCSADSGAGSSKNDMRTETARAVADFILASPAPELQVELQGGEPLLHWDIVRWFVERFRAAAESSGRRINISLMSNFLLLDDGKLEYLARAGVNLCTSLDGPAEVHEANRRQLGGSSHETVARWLGRMRQLHAEGLYPGQSPPNAVATVTRDSLGYPERIIEEFKRLGLRRVQLGPVEPFGRAAKAWSRVGVSAEEFMAFYRKAVGYMIRLNKEGIAVYEKGAAIFLAAIFGKRRSGGRWKEGLAQLAYDVEGNLYPSDEGRLLADVGDRSLRLGDVHKTRIENLPRLPLVQALLLWNLRAAQPLCSRCAYSPFCQSVRLSSAHHIALQGRPWGQLPSSRRCAIFRGVFDLLFEQLQDGAARAVLERWAEAAG